MVILVYRQLSEGKNYFYIDLTGPFCASLPFDGIFQKLVFLCSSSVLLRYSI